MKRSYRRSDSPFPSLSSSGSWRNLRTLHTVCPLPSLGQKSYPQAFGVPRFSQSGFKQLQSTEGGHIFKGRLPRRWPSRWEINCDTERPRSAVGVAQVHGPHQCPVRTNASLQPYAVKPNPVGHGVANIKSHPAGTRLPVRTHDPDRRGCRRPPAKETQQNQKPDKGTDRPIVESEHDLRDASPPTLARTRGA